MKYRLIYFVLFIPTIFLSQDISVMFHNSTGYDLDSVYVESIYIGKIKKDSVSQIFKFYQLGGDEGLGSARVFCKIGELRVFDDSPSFCGTRMNYQSLPVQIYCDMVLSKNHEGKEIVSLTQHTER